MNANLVNSKLVVAVALTLAGMAHQAFAGDGNCYVATTVKPAPAATSTASVTRVVYKAVQQTPQYDVRRPEVVSGARVTLFGNFLGTEPGIVLFNLNETSTECQIADWQPNSVTIDLPRLGLLEPKNADIQLVLPTGRIAKSFAVRFISQPDILIHEDTIPQPMPPAPAARSAMYVAPVHGGLLLQAGH